MGKFNQMTVVAAETQELATFVPSVPTIGGVPTSVVWRNQQGVGTIVAGGAVGNDIKIRLDNGNEYVCKPATFGGVFPEAFLNALREAHANQVKVVLCVAVNPRTGRAAEGYFCGLRPAGTAEVTGFNI